MTISEHRRLRIIIATLSLFLASAASADLAMAQAIVANCSSPSSCVPMTFNASVQLTKLHPDAGNVGIECRAPIPAGQWTSGAGIISLLLGRSNPIPIVNRGYAGIVTAVIQVPKVILDVPANRTLNVTCKLILFYGATAGYQIAVASAAQPEIITPGISGNFNVVATGSTITWTQAVTFPNAAP